jgi:hypothetical protein
MITLFVLLRQGDRQHYRCRTSLFGRLNTQSIEALIPESNDAHGTAGALLALLRPRSLRT